MDANTQTQILTGQIAAGDLTAKSDDLLAKAEQIKSLIASLKSTNADLETKLNACGGELNGVKAQLADLDTLAKAKTDLEGQLTTKDTDIARLTKELSKAQADLAAVTSAKDDLEAQLDDLNKQVASLSKSANDGGSPLGKAAVAGAVTVGTATLAKKMGDDDTETQPAESTTAKVAEPPEPAAPSVPVASAEPAAQPEASGSGSRTMGLVAAGATIGAAGAGLDLTSQLQARDAEIADLKARLEATTTVLQSRDAEFGIAQEQLKAAAGSETSLADLTARHTELQTQFDELAAANTKLATLQSQLDELATAKAGADASLQEKDKALVDMQAQLTTLEASLDSLKVEKADVETGLNSRNAEFDALSAKMSALSGDLDAAAAAKAQLEDTLKTQGAELSDLRAELVRVKEDGDKSVASRVAEIGVLTAGAAAAAVTIKKKDDELSEAQTRIAGFEQQLNALQDQLNDAQARVQEFEAERASGAAAGAAAGVAEAPQATSVAEPVAEPSTEEAAPNARTLVADKSAARIAAVAQGAQATSAVCPQDLSESKGIGSVFEQRLYAAGVGTYWELANLSDDEYKRILELNERQLIRMDFNEIRGDAFRLANETDSVGRLWDGGTPDDFEPLEGIGKLYEKKLYDAGICTFAALANTTAAQLEAICPGTKLRKPDYADWIAQAKRLAGL